MSERHIALVPNARNAMAESIRDRTRCAICLERIETGQEIEVRDDETRVHVAHLETEVNTGGPHASPKG